MSGVYEKNIKMNEFKNKLNSYQFRLFVMCKLEDLQSGSSRYNGIFAGGALASMAIEFLEINNINIVYNDIDIFRVLTPNEIYSETAFYKNIKELNEKRNLRLFNVLNRDIDFNTMGNGSYFYNYEMDYGHAYRGYREKENFDIISSSRKELINYVYLKTYTPYYDIKNYNKSVMQLELKNLIHTFDINGTQIGMDLKSGDIYFSDDFILFLYGKQLEIVRYNTPAHSLIRLFKKAKEMNVYYNKTEALQFYSLFQKLHTKQHNDYLYSIEYLNMESINKKLEIKNISYNESKLAKKVEEFNKDIAREMKTTNLFFGKDHYEKYLKTDLIDHAGTVLKRNKKDFKDSNKELCTYEDVSYEHLHLLKIKEVDSYFSDNLNEIKDTQLYKNSKDFANFIDENLLMLNVYLEEKLDSMNIEEKILNSKNEYYVKRDLMTGVDNLFVKYFKDFKKISKSVKKSSIYAFEDNIKFNHPSYFSFSTSSNIKNINFKDAKELSSKISKHTELITCCKNLDILNVSLYNKLFNELEAKYGQLIYPMIDSYACSKTDDKDGIFNGSGNLTEYNYYKYLAEVSKFIDKEIIENNKDFFNKEDMFVFEDDNYYIKQLNTTLELIKEGSEQSNCVGGYSNSVKSGSIIILSVRNKQLKKKYTVSLMRDEIFIKDRNGKENGELVENIYRFEQIKSKFNEITPLYECFDFVKIIGNNFNIVFEKSKFEDVLLDTQVFHNKDDFKYLEYTYESGKFYQPGNVILSDIVSTKNILSEPYIAAFFKYDSVKIGTMLKNKLKDRLYNFENIVYIYKKYKGKYILDINNLDETLNSDENNDLMIKELNIQLNDETDEEEIPF